MGYSLRVDWNNDGDFNDANEDLTTNIKSISFSRGKSDSFTNKSEVGKAYLVLNNDNGLYSPPLASGDLYDSLLPKRTVRLQYIDPSSGLIYGLFYGYIEDIVPHPHLNEQDCIITAVDGIDFLSRHDLSTILYKDVYSGSVHNAILDDAGWPSGLRRIDTGYNQIPYWYGHDVKARFAQEEIDDNEQGFSYIDGFGYFNFEDRYHRSSSTHQTSQGTFDNTMMQMTYSLNTRNLFNIIKATITPWELQSETELWRLGEVTQIFPNETNTFWGESQYFVDEWVTPVASTDYLANSASSGLGDNDTDNITVTTTKFAKTIKIEITNNVSHIVHVTLLKARGTYYDDQTTLTCKIEDETSKTNYQKRALIIDGKYLTDATFAQAFVNYILAKYKDPRAEITMTIVNKDSTNLTQIVSREISDRITVVNDKLGINGDYFIERMEHNITQGGKSHTVIYHLADSLNEDFWCLNFSALAGVSSSGQTKLGY